MPDYELLIFDWDGTLADSIGRIVESMWTAADRCELPRREAVAVKGIIGLGLPEAIASLYPELNDSRRVEAFRQAYSEHWLLLERQPSPLFPGVREALAAFRSAGYQLAVATGKSRRGLDRALAGQGWETFFEVTRCADETASKPDPLMLDEILVHCGVPAERALMVGDSVFDLQMAARAGMDAVAVGFGAQPLSVLQACGPCLSINHFEELGVWLMPSVSREVRDHVG
ncbi:HAD-IA family hydrolase [Stutzerimonas azotifigens]|uniref:HAD-IA family hydrolase n=1 Tax=Stutzerimonas azotifigens TaxID=291995 RepID=UPI0003F9AF75|nr:HAD-IA family hydrolase [Stutzerimonas azotifigens]